MAQQTTLQILPNASFLHPRHASMRPDEQAIWKFFYNGVQGVPLLDAFAGQLQGLAGLSDELLPANFGKANCLIAVQGYKAFRKMKNVQCVRGGLPQPIQRHRLVRCIAEVVHEFLGKAEPTSEHDGTFVLGSHGIGLENLYLIELQRHGKTLLPVLGYMVTRVDPEFMQPVFPMWFDSTFTIIDGGGF
ncbi:hypothetical protein PsYK624_049450 [Phanerochaete sordida]|uniref:Uncharacterized protein n=1 Tax=Phanerochaete sordida TaxID=48140 RepID=A0A9P3LC70_9APHY|nr:hypothetical protein PsYK624_049450 [Phanerochaete sordida]